MASQRLVLGLLLFQVLINDVEKESNTEVENFAANSKLFMVLKEFQISSE